MIFRKLFKVVKLPLSEHTMGQFDICYHYIDSRLLSKAFSKLSLNLNNGTFQIINHVTNPAIPLKIAF